MKEKLKSKGSVYALCYLIAAAVWLIGCTICAVQESRLTPWHPEESDFILDGINIKDKEYYDYTDRYVSVHGDPWMMYPQPVTVNGVSFRLRAFRATGTPELYYRKPDETRFHRIAPTDYDPASGTYFFDTGLLKNVQIRIDPLTTPGCLFDLEDLTFNTTFSLAKCFVPKLHQLVLLALLPALCGAFVLELNAAVQEAKKAGNAKNKEA